MTDTLTYDFTEWREWFKNRFRETVPMAAESGETYQTQSNAPLPFDEQLMQAIWAHQLLSPNGLRLVDGRMLEILDSGRWNHGAGPDFTDAKILIDGEVLNGDIELHLDAADWMHHGHDRDYDYNGVVLHVIWDGDPTVTEDVRHNGRPIPRFNLQPYVFPDIDTLRRSRR